MKYQVGFETGNWIHTWVLKTKFENPYQKLRNKLKVKLKYDVNLSFETWVNVCVHTFGPDPKMKNPKVEFQVYFNRPTIWLFDNHAFEQRFIF